MGELNMIPKNFIHDFGLAKFVELTELNSNFRFFGIIQLSENGYHYDQFEMDIQYVEPKASKEGLELWINGNILLSLTENFIIDFKGKD